LNPNPSPSSNQPVPDAQAYQEMWDTKRTASAATSKELLRDAPSNQLSFAEKIGQMVDAEWTARENRRLGRLLRAAKLTKDAAMEDVWTTQGRGITKAEVRELRSEEHTSELQSRENLVCRLLLEKNNKSN